MLLLPYLAGVIVAGFAWVELPLLATWLAGYLFSYFALQALKTQRPQRFRSQLVWYGAATAVLAVPVLVTAPRVLLYAPAYAALLAVNVCYALRRRERALLNGLASVAQSCLMVFVIATVAGQAPSAVLEPFLLVFLYLAGTVVYVKTMIRERDSEAYRLGSVVYHLLALMVAVAFGPVPAVVFGLLLLRAWALPPRGLAPKQVGIIEIAASALVLAGAVI